MANQEKPQPQPAQATVPTFQLLVDPVETPAAPPYANTTYTYGLSPTDVTILFLRAPLLSDETAIALAKTAVNGLAKTKGAVVSSVTLPRNIALDLARQLVKLLEGAAK